MHTRGLPDGDHLTTQHRGVGGGGGGCLFLFLFLFVCFFLMYPIDFQSTLSCALVAFGYPKHKTPTAFEVTSAGRLAGRRWLIEGPVSSSSVVSVTAVGCVWHHS